MQRERTLLDVDPEGAPWFRQQFDALPRTRAHETRRGGVHLLFRARAGLKCSRGRIARGVDVRAEGGYVIWWPSKGLPFEDHPLVEWPDWLLTEAGRPEGAGRGGAYGAGGFLPPAPSRRSIQGIQKRVRRILQVVECARHGDGRNDKLYWAACRFSEMIADGVMPEAIAWKLLEGAARVCGHVAKHGLVQTRATIASGLRTGMEAQP